MPLITEALRGAGAVLVDAAQRGRCGSRAGSERSSRRATSSRARSRPGWRAASAWRSTRALSGAQRLEREFPQVVRIVPRGGLRPSPRRAPGRSRRALPHGRRRRGRARAHVDRGFVGLRRGRLHGRARRQPAREQLAARGAGLRRAGGGGRSPRAWGAARSPWPVRASARGVGDATATRGGRRCAGEPLRAAVGRGLGVIRDADGDSRVALVAGSALRSRPRRRGAQHDPRRRGWSPRPRCSARRAAARTGGGTSPTERAVRHPNGPNGGRDPARVFGRGELARSSRWHPFVLDPTCCWTIQLLGHLFH